MNIKEFEKKTGVYRDIIRYYNDHGLFDKKTSLFREEYGKNDAIRLAKIILLRKMGIDVTVIYQLFRVKERASLHATLEKQLTELEKEKDKFPGAYNLCAAMLERTAELTEGEREPIADELEADRWWTFMEAEEAAGHSFVDCWQDQEAACFSIFELFFVKDLRKNKFVNFCSTLLVLIVGIGLTLLLGIMAMDDWFVFLIAMPILAVCSLPFYLLGKKNPRLANRLCGALLIGLCVVVFIVAVIIWWTFVNNL